MLYILKKIKYGQIKTSMLHYHKEIGEHMMLEIQSSLTPRRKRDRWGQLKMCSEQNNLLLVEINKKHETAN